jgi:ABC-type multidrug transport system ATPase subunit
MYYLETTDLTHKFSETETVLNNINMQVLEGSIYGFLGPNGAGKTTTLRLILGLLKKQQGEICVLGQSFEKNRLAILKKVGSLIESPSIYAHLTAKENLKLLQKIYQCSNERIPEVLNLVGLANTGSKKAGQFSLGMKQRLSIAIALLNNPSLLILDEPTNGLDPNGIIEMRAFLKKLNQEQKITIIISSHMLHEIEKLVTHVGIINKGTMRFQGTFEELMKKQQQASVNTLETSDNINAVKIISNMGLTAHIENKNIVMPVISKEKIGAVNQQLAANGIQVFEIATVKNDLEAIFMDITKN